MKLMVNGEQVEHRGRGSLPELLAQIGANPLRVAVLVNDDIVPPAARESRVLRDGDRVEVITFAGGG